MAGACGFGAGIGDGVGYGQEELDDGEEQEQGSHRACELWGSRGIGETLTDRIALLWSVFGERGCA